MALANLLLEPPNAAGVGEAVSAWAGSLTEERLAAVLTEAAAAVSATQARMAVALAVFVERGGHAHGGINTVGQWGAINLGASACQAEVLATSGAAAREHAALRDTWESGALSTEKARIVTSVATSESIDRWVAMALEASASQLARIASTFRRATAEPTPDDLRDRAESVGLWWENQPDGLVKLIALLEPDDAALVRAALEAMLERQWRSADEPCDGEGAGAGAPAAPDPGHPASNPDHASGADTGRAGPPGDECGEPVHADPAGPGPDGDQAPRTAPAPTAHAGPRRRAEALAALAESGLATGPVPVVGAERTVVHLGVDATYLAGRAEAGRCNLHDLGAVDLATARLLACDTRVRAFLRGADGRVIDEGREQRLVTTRQRRLLQHRDGGCTFPGCTNRRFVDAHHAVPWYDGGPTDLDNLLLLCRAHHRAQHQGTFAVEVLGDGRFRFRDAWGHDLGPPKQRGRPASVPASTASTTRARSGGDPRYSLNLAVTALAG